MLDGLGDVSQIPRERHRKQSQQSADIPRIVEPPVPTIPMDNPAQQIPPISTTASANVSHFPPTTATVPPLPFAVPPIVATSGTSPTELAQLQLQQQQLWMAFMTQMMARIGMPSASPVDPATLAGAAGATPVSAPTRESVPATAPSPPAAPPAASSSTSPPIETTTEARAPAPAPRRRIMTESATNTTVLDDRPAPPSHPTSRNAATNTTFVAKPVAAARDNPSARPPTRSRFQSADSPEQSVSDINPSPDIDDNLGRNRPPGPSAKAFFELSMPVEEPREADSVAPSDAGSIDAADSASQVAGRRAEHPRARTRTQSSGHRPLKEAETNRAKPTERGKGKRREDPADLITELCSDPEQSFIVVESRKLNGFRGSTSRAPRRGARERDESSDTSSDDRVSMTTEEEDVGKWFERHPMLLLTIYCDLFHQIRANLIATKYIPRHHRHAPVDPPASHTYAHRDRSRPRHHATRTAQLRDEAVSVARADFSFASLDYLRRYGLDQGINGI